MTFEDFKAEDFVMEESFREYCLGNNLESIVFWKQWIKNNPLKKDEIDKAKEILFLLNGNNDSESYKIDEGVFKTRLKEKGIFEQSSIKELPKKPVPFIKRYAPYAAAAAILLFILIKLSPLQKQEENTLAVDKNDFLAPANEDIEAGSDKAILTLSDGRTILLDSTSGGNISIEGAKIDLTATELIYNETQESSAVTYNTITTPKGGHFRIVLADGSRVWLNAQSSLRYPTSFPGAERKVELKGEAYLEVAENAQKPFLITFNDASIQVLGTHFNIKSYDDDPIIKSTLLEGSIKLTSEGKSVILKKGQQVQFSNISLNNSKTPRLKVIDDVDLEQVVAWKNGTFNFENEHISDIMRQLARWYDVGVVYEGKVPDKHYTGFIRKSVNISEVIKMLELAGGVRITVNNKKLYVREK